MALKDWKRTRKSRSGEEWKKGNMTIVIIYRDDIKLATFWEGNSILFEKETNTKAEVLRVAKKWRKNN